MSGCLDKLAGYDTELVWRFVFLNEVLDPVKLVLNGLDIGVVSYFLIRI